MNYLDYFQMPMANDAIMALSLSVGIAMVGVALALFVAEPHSPTTRAISLTFGMVGISVFVYLSQIVLHPDGRNVPWFARLPIMDAVMFSSFFVWMLRVARAAQPTRQAMRVIRICSWAYGAVLAVYLALGSIFPIERFTQFFWCLEPPQTCTQPGSLMFVVPVALLSLIVAIVGAVLFSQRVDPAERVRAIGAGAASPFLFAAYVLPGGYNVLSTLVGLLIFMLGAIRYYVMQGQRGQFMSRFLSPEVVKLVRYKGIEHTLQPRVMEITVVCCDLRGFTRFSQMQSSGEVLRLLGEYYDDVGAAVSEFGATIKDYAGDGVLILIGAPLPEIDHASKGLILASRLNETIHRVIARWGGPDTGLGAGLGVASGPVTVGAIGSISRMEYTAIGPAVNLASRLCAQALDNEILVDARTSELARSDKLYARGPIAIKGMGDLAHFALVS